MQTRSLIFHNSCLPSNTCKACFHMRQLTSETVRWKKSAAIMFCVSLTHRLTACPLNIHWFSHSDCAVFPSLCWYQPLEWNSKPSTSPSLLRGFSSAPPNVWKSPRTSWKSTCTKATGSTETSCWRSRTSRPLISCRGTQWKSSMRWEFFCKVQWRKTRRRRGGGRRLGGNH